MNEGSSGRTYPSVYPSLPIRENLMTFPTSTPMTTPSYTGTNPVYSQSGSMAGQAPPNWQTNPLQHPPPNTFPASNVMPTPGFTGNTSEYRPSAPFDAQANLTGQMYPPQDNYQNASTKHHYPSYQQGPVPIVAIGNPGSGKSTILNTLAGQVLFESGISIGHGLTDQMDRKEANGRIFVDTPGVADDETYQKAAGVALSKVFNQGGRMKILFFISEEAGRIVSQDVTTMKLVLEQVPEIGRNYGIIVNKIPKRVLSQLSEGEAFLKLVLSLYAGIEDRFKNKNTLLLPLNKKLDDMKNALLHPSEIHPDLEDFINTKVPEAYITPGTITEIHLEDFEQLCKQVKEAESKLKNQEKQKNETQKLVHQYENIEKQKVKEREKILKRNEEELEKMKKNIREREDEMRRNQQTAETQIKEAQERSEIEMRHLKQKEKEINNQKEQVQKKRETAKRRKEMANRGLENWNVMDLFGTDFGLKNATANEMTRRGNGMPMGSWGQGY